MGAEGIDVEHRRQLLVAGNAREFARVERVLTDGELWRGLATRGRRQMLRLHGAAPFRARLAEVLAGVLKRPRRRPAAVERAPDPRATAVAAVRRAVTALPAGASVLVVSRGDPELVRLRITAAGTSRRRRTDGTRASPRGQRRRAARLEARLGDAEYLVIPASSFWCSTSTASSPRC